MSYSQILIEAMNDPRHKMFSDMLDTYFTLDDKRKLLLGEEIDISNGQLHEHLPP
jgi:hypothetical protein